MDLRMNLFPDEHGRPEGEMDMIKTRDETKRVTIAEEVLELGSSEASSPVIKKFGVSSPSSTNADMDEGTIAIAKIERRLKKNIPNDERKKLEAEKESLLSRRNRGTAPGETPNMPARSGQVRRKVGNVAMHVEESQEGKKDKRSKAAAAPPAHPKTMARMKDWKREIERRMIEQEQIDSSTTKEDSDWLKAVDGPVSQVVDFFNEFVDGMKQAIGMSERPQETQQSPPRALPEQTFSRRL
ncbi:hypothetical protein GUITHDRAFT_106533 [Guillardia theta CCMP2712]|uniref:Uncharacterized protein n=1 Tax=Guillardia theta (strain CCMP2712) TaxID=905079 RepID=L1JGC1_GUITC|nr:hypothetical protein GUITHDRAFT_106533 [Guillardia theta CCMP2712]EKX47546.1 hypothetical protein GUITHDRAFT_106533 [Guillardia theta CCMP2712]|eukprot:XP_005834526.1 hypothetical protein GUITHDRAFT_106533 [Guillardia theta CCMP2712]